VAPITGFHEAPRFIAREHDVAKVTPDAQLVAESANNPRFTAVAERLQVNGDGVDVKEHHIGRIPIEGHPDRPVIAQLQKLALASEREPRPT
jgi:hypothetical protein